MLSTFHDLCTMCMKNQISLQTDSRQVQKGDIFVALPPASPGEPDQSPEHIRMAFNAGASVIVASAHVQDLLDEDLIKAPGAAFVFSDDVRMTLGDLAARVYGTQHLDFPVIGITGTNGKTTCDYLLEHLYLSKGLKAGILGTIAYRWPGHSEPSSLTTPGCLKLHQCLHAMKQAGTDAVIMEVSSHAADQKRIAGIPFSVAAFTNLTQDHLDYHKTFDDYFQAKRSLFTFFPKEDKRWVVNADDPYGLRLLDENPDAFAFGLRTLLPGHECLHAKVLKSDTSGLDIFFRWLKTSGAETTWRFQSPLICLHNASNLLLTSAIALSLGFSPDDLQCLSSFMGVCGRLERIPAGIDGTECGVFVDYAHTPDALYRVLNTLRQSQFRRIITVFGCGGDRDKTKRPLMGKAVAELSDIAIVTSDNPRTENPERILDDIMPGLSSMKNIFREADRRNALEIAVSLLRPGDALLVAGKGHEDYQIIGHEKHHFSDQEILKELLAHAHIS